MDQMQREWQVWQAVCGELAQAGVNINDFEALGAALKRWGEEVAALRMSQERKLVAEVLADYRAAYPLPVDK